jgi:uncharacterized SAM-binding protein YcdF (DUF218 family)
MRATYRAAVYLVGAATAALLAGFVVFASVVSRDHPPHVANADGIVVLTGGQDRVLAAVRLLESGNGRRLLVSGAHKATHKRDIARLAGGLDGAMLARIDLGHEAQDTPGNAVEARDWSRRHGYSRLLVVTSAYHMPRSLVELARELPEVELVAHPVVSRNVHLSAWWLHPTTAELIVKEYVKFLPSAARLAFVRAFSGAPMRREAITVEPASGQPQGLRSSHNER